MRGLGPIEERVCVRVFYRYITHKTWNVTPSDFCIFCCYFTLHMYMYSFFFYLTLVFDAEHTRGAIDQNVRYKVGCNTSVAVSLQCLAHRHDILQTADAGPQRNTLYIILLWKPKWMRVCVWCVWYVCVVCGVVCLHTYRACTLFILLYMCLCGCVVGKISVFAIICGVTYCSVGIRTRKAPRRKNLRGNRRVWDVRSEILLMM